MQQYNVVVFGGTGAGKSSVINLIVGNSVAQVSPDVAECTTVFRDYPFTHDSIRYTLWDTPGLKEPRSTLADQAEAVMQAHTLVRLLTGQGGVNLLVYCISGVKDVPTTSGPPSTIQSHYRLFHELFCPNVPLVVVVTHLDSKQRRGDWWMRNEERLRRSELSFAGSARITSHAASAPAELEEAARDVRDLLIHCTRKSHWRPRAVRERLRLTKEAAISLASMTFSGWDTDISARVMVGMLMTRCGLDQDEAGELVKRIRGNGDLSPCPSRNGEQHWAR